MILFRAEVLIHHELKERCVCSQYEKGLGLALTGTRFVVGGKVLQVSSLFLPVENFALGDSSAP